MDKEVGMVRFTQKKMLKTILCLLVIISCATNIMAFGFNAAGARSAIDDFKTKLNALNLQVAQSRLQAFNAGLTSVQDSQYYNSSQSLRDGYASAAAIYKTQNDAFTALVARVPKTTELDALEADYTARLKALNDEVATLSLALASAQNNAVQAVKDATARVEEALKALDTAKTFFSSVTAGSTATASGSTAQ